MGWHHSRCSYQHWHSSEPVSELAVRREIVGLVVLQKRMRACSKADLVDLRDAAGMLCSPIGLGRNAWAYRERRMILIPLFVAAMSLVGFPRGARAPGDICKSIRPWTLVLGSAMLTVQGLTHVARRWERYTSPDVAYTARKDRKRNT
jgi:hypothetical protein